MYNGNTNKPKKIFTSICQFGLKLFKYIIILTLIFTFVAAIICASVYYIIKKYGVIDSCIKLSNILMSY